MRLQAGMLGASMRLASNLSEQRAKDLASSSCSCAVLAATGGYGAAGFKTRQNPAETHTSRLVSLQAGMLAL